MMWSPTQSFADRNSEILKPKTTSLLTWLCETLVSPSVLEKGLPYAAAQAVANPVSSPYSSSYWMPPRTHLQMSRSTIYHCTRSKDLHCVNASSHFPRKLSSYLMARPSLPIWILSTSLTPRTVNLPSNPSACGI